MSYWRDSDCVGIGDIIGKTMRAVDIDGKEEIHFQTSTGEHFVMYHEQDCCESVEIEDINGEFEDLIGEPILMAEEVSQEGESEWGTQTWTFYKIATIKGTVVIRWLGESNGYYSESVDFVKLKEDVG